MRSARSLILDVGVQYLFHTILVLSVFLLFAGHNAPGGGFAGGLVAGAALALRDIAAGTDGRTASMRVAPEIVLAVGLAVASVTALAGVVGGGDVLESTKVIADDVPLLGTVKATSALPFDIGVYLVVVGVVATILRRLGEDPGEAPETEVVKTGVDGEGELGSTSSRGIEP